MSSRLLATAIRSLIRHRDRSQGNPAAVRTAADVGISTGVAYQLVADDGEEDDPGEELCDGFLSGFFDWTNPFRFGRDGYFSRAVFLRATGRSGWENSVELLGSLPGLGYAPGCSIYLPFPGSFPINMGSRYTGTMRKVVQLMQGMLKPIHYNFCFGQTHGIYIAANGSHWVIEISSWAGITAWEIPVCEVLTPERQIELNVDLPYIPSVNDGLPPLSERIVLAPASEMSEYAVTFPFYIECGWAFSYSGHEAQNVMWEETTEADPWRKAHRFRMRIVGASDRPVSAYVELLETKYLWMERYGGPKFPYMLPYSGITMLTFDTRSNPPILGPPPSNYDQIPLYVFYLEGNDTPVVWRTGGITPPPDDPFVSNDIAPENRFECADGHFTERKPGSARTHDNEHGLYGDYGIAYGSPRIYEPDGPLNSPIVSKPTFIATGSYKKYESSLYGGWNIVTTSPDNVAFSQHWLVQTSHISDGTWERREASAFMVPFGDREQVYLFNKQVELFWGEALVRWDDGYGYGAYDFWRYHSSGAIPCGAPPTPYRAIACGQELPPLYGTDVYLPVTGSVDWAALSIVNMFTPADACYGTEEAHATRVWCPTYQLPAPLTTCRSPTALPPEPIEELSAEQSLYAIDHRTNQFVRVKHWPNEYESVDAYTAIIEDISSGSQVLVSIPDAFSGKSIVSAEMNGYQGDEYHYSGFPENYYPLTGLGPGLDRGFFGVPFKPGE